MPQNGLSSLLERHWAESALAIGAIVIAAASLWVAYDTERTNRQLVISERQETRPLATGFGALQREQRSRLKQGRLRFLQEEI
jgi:hypothetical protein